MCSPQYLPTLVTRFRRFSTLTGRVIFEYWPLQRLVPSVPYHYVLRRLSGQGFRPRRDGPLLLGGAGLLLLAALAWSTTAPSLSALPLGWQLPRLPAANPLTVSEHLAPRSPLAAPAHQRFSAWPPGAFGSPTRAAGGFASGVLGPPKAAAGRRDSAGLSTSKDAFMRCWRVIKLSFR